MGRNPAGERRGREHDDFYHVRPARFRGGGGLDYLRLGRAGRATGIAETVRGAHPRSCSRHLHGVDIVRGGRAIARNRWRSGSAIDGAL